MEGEARYKWRHGIRAKKKRCLLAEASNRRQRRVSISFLNVVNTDSNSGNYRLRPISQRQRPVASLQIARYFIFKSLKHRENLTNNDPPIWENPNTTILPLPAGPW